MLVTSRAARLDRQRRRGHAGFPCGGSAHAEGPRGMQKTVFESIC